MEAPACPSLDGARSAATCGSDISLDCMRCKYCRFWGGCCRDGEVLAFLSAVDRLALVWTGGLAYLGLIALLVWQAMRGQSVIRPDAATIAAAAALAAGVATSIAIIVARVWNRNRKAPAMEAALRILTN